MRRSAYIYISILILLFVAGLLYLQKPQVEENTVPQKHTQITRQSLLAWAVEQQFDWNKKNEYGETPLSNCLPPITELDDELGLRAYSIDASQTLYEITCQYYAYQGGYMYILVQNDDESKTVVRFNEPISIADYYDTPVLRGGLPTFNEETNKLHLFTKSRGLGDCGTVADYTLEDASFILDEARERGCEYAVVTEAYVPPEEWNLIYQRE